MKKGYWVVAYTSISNDRDLERKTMDLELANKRWKFLTTPSHTICAPLRHMVGYTELTGQHRL